jgi:soluble lytic murein transglycosylase-like protein
MNRGLRGSSHPSMVDGTQRVEFSAGFGHQTVGARGFGGVDQLSQKSSRHMGHVASDEKVPVGFCDAECGVEAAQRAAIFDFIGHNRKTEVRVALHRTDESDISSGILHRGGDLLDHGCASQGQQGFVASHAPTGSARQNVARGSHEMILATSTGMCPKEYDSLVELNKRVYICLIVALAMLAASPSRAADSNTPAMSVPAAALHKTQVVKADPRTGKLVRSVVVSSRPVLTKITPPLEKTTGDLNAIVDKAARAHDVDPLLVHSMIKVESNYNVHAVSNKGAEGLMQLTPSTARMLGVSNSFDPQQNIEAGVKYLKYLKDLYKDDRLALAAYNAGPGAVDKYKWIPPYAETENYVYQVGKRYGEARRAADAAKPALASAAATVVELKPVEIKPAAVEQFIDENGRLHLKTAQ